MSSKTRVSRRSRRSCTMICITQFLILCHLFTLSAHLSLLSCNAASTDTQQQHQNHHRQQLHFVSDGQNHKSHESSSSLLTLKSKSADDELPKGEEDSNSAIRLEDLKHHNLHRLMSEQDLRRTFQVDSHDQVPEYEILKLTVNSDGSHLISPISDLGELTSTTTNNNQQQHEHNNNNNHNEAQNDSQLQMEQTKAEATSKTSQNRFKRSARTHQMVDSSERSETNYYYLPTTSTTTSRATSDRTRTTKNNHHHHEVHQDEQQQQLNETTNTSTTTSENQHKAADNHRWKSSSNDAAATDAAHDDHGDIQADAKGSQLQQSPTNERRSKSSSSSKKEDKLIVMNLSMFGKDFKLRLKRNADFQQRIKDMKMFMAESTKDGQLKYTEIKNQQQQQQQKLKQQEPHKRSATPAEENPTLKSASSDQIGSSAATNVWNIGNTYHDEDNLAALLIDHNTKTGRMEVDGTIGNDFVIKPMPQATIDALLLKRQQQSNTSRFNSLAGGNSNVNNAIADVDLERKSTSSSSPPVAAGKSSSNLSAPKSLAESAMQLHADDPHDDDEMFLDEDEAIELAHLHSAASNSSFGLALSPNQNQKAASEQPRALSKAASERKWRKYRKLLAQTQVPKPGSLAHQPASGSAADLPSSSSQAGRTRRHAHPQQESPEEPLQVSHHIVYRQRPSSESSSSEHQHSFMFSPGQANMEQLAYSFSPRRQNQQAAELDNMIDSPSSEHLSRRASAWSNLSGESQDQLTDHLEDPLGGQFYLEPGTVTGVERAGLSDWSLVSRGKNLAPPPYAINASHQHESAYYHQQQRLNSTTTEQHQRFKRQAQHRMPMRARGSQVRRKRQAPDTVWPEVLLVVDYDSFLLHGGNSMDVKRYFVSFWNGVDLRYKLLVHPHIRISLAGMIVAKDRDATPYLERNRLRAPNADAVDAAGALTDMGKYLYREDRLPTYDLAVVITKLDMCRRRYEGGRCNRGTAGFAYVGGACVVNKRLEKVNSVAIIEDSGGFSGIIVAAHEVGHLLGCVHDGSPPPSYLGGPGATHCPWEDGYIMSDLRHTERGFRWSQCSVEQFKHFLNGETATCLYNYPHESQMLHRLLPGTMLSLDEQCKRDRGTNACFKDARVCAQLFCFDSASGYCVSYRPAAEGSPCGEGQVCRNGKCVGEIENIIPDYTHQSQTVVARRPSSHSLSRLADNGISASSTSTATSSPDNKIVSPVSPQLSSRMDSFPLVDSPAPVVSSAPANYRMSSFGSYTNAAPLKPNTGMLVMRQSSSPTSTASSPSTYGIQQQTSSYPQRKWMARKVNY